jgi:hypothetical protein
MKERVRGGTPQITIERFQDEGIGAGRTMQQRQIIAEKREHLDHAIHAIERAEQVFFAPGGQTDWEPFRKIIEVIRMRNRKDWMRNYYTQSAAQQRARRRVQVGADDPGFLAGCSFHLQPSRSFEVKDCGGRSGRNNRLRHYRQGFGDPWLTTSDH